MRLTIVAVFLGLLSLACAVPFPTKYEPEVDENGVHALQPPHARPELTTSSTSSSRSSSANRLNRKVTVEDLNTHTIILNATFYPGKPLNAPGLSNHEADEEAQDIVKGFLMNHKGLSKDLGKEVASRRVIFGNSFRYLSRPEGSFVHFKLEAIPAVPGCNPECHATALRVKGTPDTFRGKISADLTGFPVIGWDEPLKKPTSGSKVK
ncbi:hypothetical protein LENED_010312 [Lentinula edodes]|uniref:Uncharacterized protein n=1 Tax=Lentinula edodes TaxID=5353 RepID=A0A1Q3EM41_LENED|nr:hypothetical protein F5877DRAFT_69548 [Lentinula edodes]GAW08260.1 hypothetical protein LENED_010312 [Lentinula edodes]